MGTIQNERCWIADHTRSATSSAASWSVRFGLENCSHRRADVSLSATSPRRRSTSARKRSVATPPGQSTDTESFAPGTAATSAASASDSAMTAALDVQYPANDGAEKSPAADAVFTTWQSSPWASMPGTNARMPCSTPPRLTSSMAAQSSAPSSQATPGRITPALLHSRWTSPSSPATRSASRWTSASSATSVTAVSTRGAPAARTSRPASSSRDRSRSAIATSIPSAANRRASAKPIPLAPPVTTATFPAHVRSIDSVMSTPSDARLRSPVPRHDHTPTRRQTNGRRRAQGIRTMRPNALPVFMKRFASAASANGSVRSMTARSSPRAISSIRPATSS